MSVLSELPDGMGFFCGFADGDSRQINVRLELDEQSATSSDDPMNWDHKYHAYVAGTLIGKASSKAAAEAMATAWMVAHPEQESA